MIYDFVITKPELNEETLAHYGVKGMKLHKRKAKSTLSKINTTFNRLMGLTNSDIVTYNNGRTRKWDSEKNTWVKDSGKANSKSGQAGLKNVKTTKVNVKSSRPRSRKKTVASGKVKVYKSRR